MSILFFDDASRESLLPLSFTRPVADFRIGILTIAEKWAKRLSAPSYSFVTEEYLQKKFPKEFSSDNLFINGSICPDEELVNAIKFLQVGEALVFEQVLIAIRLDYGDTAGILYNHKFNFSGYKNILDITFWATGAAQWNEKRGSLTDIVDIKEYVGSFIKITYPEDLFSHNDVELRKDFTLLTTGRTSAQLSATNTILGNHFFAEEGASAECATFNTLEGPIYLAKNSQVWEGSHIRGSFALGEHSQVKMGSKIYGATTIGPHCRVGGEVSNSILFAYSSKGHEGFLGNSVLGEWCNIGADTNNSNMKNNYSEVRLWDYVKQSFRKTGLQFCGLIMADHAKCGINTMFNTGTVVGVSANVFGAGYPRNYIPDFAWGGAQGLEVYPLAKVFETAERVYERRNRVFDATEETILTHIFEQTQAYRRF
jgi:UDP-N-acetylglucosamine diphosphorylase/glucosamine-1-phosphate N-acetyltransferase